MTLFRHECLIYWETWRHEELGSNQNWISLFYLRSFDLKISCWIEFFHFKKQRIVGLIVWATVIKSGDLVWDVRLDKPPGSHCCSFLPPRISELRAFPSRFLLILCIFIIIFTEFLYFSCRDVMYRWSVSEGKRSKLHWRVSPIASTLYKLMGPSPLNHAAHLVLSTVCTLCTQTESRDYSGMEEATVTLLKSYVSAISMNKTALNKVLYYTAERHQLFGYAIKSVINWL